MIGKVLIGSDGYLGRDDLKKMVQRNKFSKYLPYDACDPETGLYINQDETIGFIWECVPVSFAGEDIYNVLKGLIRVPFPEGSVLQFILYADPYIEPYLEAYKKTKIREEGIVKKVVDWTTDFFMKGKNGVKNAADIPLRNFRLFVAIKMPYKKLEVDIEDIYNTSFEALNGARLYPVKALPQDLLGFLRRLFNNMDNSENAELYNDNIPIRDQIILAETEIVKTKNFLKIGDKFFRCTTPKILPTEVTPLMLNQIIGGIYGVVSDNDQIKTPFFYTLNIIFQDMKAKIHTKCNLILQQQAFGSFAPSLKRKQEEFLWAADELEKGTRFFRIIPIIWVYGDTEKKANESIVRIKRIWEAQGCVMQEDTGILPILFLSALPFGVYTEGNNIDHLERDFFVPEETVSYLAPIQADFHGGGAPILLFTGRKGQIITLDIFDRRATNHNALVLASSGSGKSFFVNFLAFNSYASGGMIRIIDIGGSYKKMTHLLGAKYIDFSKGTNICLNPFSNVAEPEHDLPIISYLVAQMVYSTEDRVCTETEMTIIKNAVKWAYEVEGQEASIDTVYHYLSTFPKYAVDFDFDCPDKQECAQDIKTAAQTLAFNLFEFTSNGSYGKFFNGKSNFDISKDEFVVLELEHLKAQKDLFKVVTYQIVNATTFDLYLSDRSRPRFIIFDEAWQFLGESAFLKAVVEEGFRRARKYNGSFTVVTQSIMDLQQFGSVGDVLRANTAFKFYLESPDFEKAKTEKLIDYDEFTMKILKSVKTNSPNYSEIFMDTPFGLGVVRLVVDPRSYYVYTSNPKDIVKVENLLLEGYSYEEAIEKLVQQGNN